MSGGKGLNIQTIKNVTVVSFVESAIIDAQKIEQLAQQLYELVDEQNRKHMILDFSGVKFMGSQTLGVLINLNKKIEKIKGKMVICSLRKDLHKLFTITRLDRIFKFYQHEEEALNSFGVYTG